MDHVLIVGGGFKGIIASYFLSRSGCKVTLVESSPALGGLMRGKEWNGFYLDKGCHIFGNDDREMTEILLDIMDWAIVPVSARYASVTAGKLSKGFTIPDLTVLGKDVCAKILYEMVKAQAEGVEDTQEAESLEQALHLQFGPTAADYLGKAAWKFLRVHPNELDASVLRVTNFGRIRLLPEVATRMLKSHPVLDERLADSTQDDPFRHVPGALTTFPHRHFYPAEKGMQGFCDAAERYLAAAGIELRLGTRLKSMQSDAQGVSALLTDGTERRFDRVFWAADLGQLSELVFGEDSIAGLVHKVPMVLYYFVLPQDRVGPYEFLHDFMPEHLVYRISAPGHYGRQIKDDGSTYICCEVTTEIGSPVWEDPEGHAESVWGSAVAHGAVTGEDYDDVHILKTPVSYQVGKPGHSAALRSLKERIAAASPRIVVETEAACFRYDILRAVRQLVAA